MKKKNTKNINIVLRNFITFFLIFAIISGLLSLYNKEDNSLPEISIATLVHQINNEEVESIIVTGNKLEITLNNKEKEVSKKESNESLITLLNNYEIEIAKINSLDISIKEKPEPNFLLTSILPFFKARVPV